MKIKTQIINIGIEEDPNLDRLNIETREKKSKLFNLLKEHKDVFAWSYQNMPGIDPDMVQRCISLHLVAKPVEQMLRRIQPG